MNFVVHASSVHGDGRSPPEFPSRNSSTMTATAELVEPRVPPVTVAELDDLIPNEPVGDVSRIIRTPGVLGGKPTVRGTRMSVTVVLGHLASGRTREQILSDFDFLEDEDITQCLRYAAWRASDCGDPVVRRAWHIPS